MDPLDQVWDRYIDGNGLRGVVACPLCGHSGAFEGGDSARAGRGICPKCGSNGRSRLYAVQMSRMGVGSRFRKILYFNPEPPLKAVLEGEPDVVLRSTGLGNIEATGKRDGEFDMVLCNYLMDRAPDESKALREVRRVLAGGGVAMLSVFFAKDGLRTASVPRRYTRGSYVSLLEANGFSAEVLTAEEVCTRRMCALMDIDPDECVTLARPES